MNDYRARARAYAHESGKLLLRIAIAALILWAAYRSRMVFGSVIASIVLTYMLLPIVEFFCKKRIMPKRAQRTLVTVLVFIFFITVLGFGLTYFVSEITKGSIDIIGSGDSFKLKLQSLFKHTVLMYDRYVPIEVRDLLANMDTSNITAWATTKASAFLTATTSSIRFLFELILIPVLAFYFVLDSKGISKEIYGLVPARDLKNIMRIGRETGEIIYSYMVGQFILCVLSGVLTALFLWIADIPYLAVLSIFAGVTRFIPMIGPVLSGIPMTLVALLCPNGGWNLAICTIVFVTVMHFTESKFVMPKLIGKRMHLNPAIVIISLLIGAELCGFMGMFLSVPVAAILRGLIRLYYIKPKRGE